MASISINIGDAFLLTTPPNDRHLYIAIAQIADDSYLFVNATTRRDNSETTCILTPGADLPDFIKNESVIVYKYAREISVVDVDKLIVQGECTSKGYCSTTIVEQIQQGGLVSKRLANKYKTALKAFLEAL
ncbi:MAG: hypothetical protein LH613_11290 [Chamaesiphon sp.]|nr:hypothetical protein [Chamaesiphon sp.]